MRGLRILVIVMGVMLVAGVAGLAAAIVFRLSHPRPVPNSSAAAPIMLPAGARIETIGVGSDRLVVAVVLPDGSRQLLVIDPESGRQIGVIPLDTAR